MISAIVEGHDLAKAFLVWARLRTSDSRTLREVADLETWHFTEMENLPFLRDVWMRAPAEAREILIREVFQRDPGEPFESIRHSHPFEGVGLLPPIGYVPSQTVHAVRQLVQAAGDKDGLKLVDELIEERRTACELAVRAVAQWHEPYRFDADEQELVARLLTLARRAGFRAAVLPEVRVSHQAPPAFVRNPELEDLEAEGAARRRGRIPRDSNRPVQDEFPTIEELLGCYRPRTGDVVLGRRGINWAARRLGISKD